MVSAAAEEMERSDAITTEQRLDGFLHRKLQFEDPLRMKKGFGRLVEVHILDVEIDEERFAVPKRTRDVPALGEKGVQFLDRVPFMHAGIDPVALGQVAAGRFA